MTTHYVPAYTEVNGRKQRAVCGAWVTAQEHSTEPRCEPCLDWLTAEKATEHLTADDVFGPPLPPSNSIRDAADRLRQDNEELFGRYARSGRR